MIILRTANSSPFGRKCVMAAMRLKLMDRIKLVDANFMNADDPLHRENPLGKMPVLTTPEGMHVYDSPVIVESLDHLAGGDKVIPKEWSQRMPNLLMQALADGIMDAAVTITMEARLRPRELWHKPALEYQRVKIAKGLIEAEAKSPDPTVMHIGAISLAVTLGYLDRRGQYDWRPKHPRLIAWLDEFRRHAPEYDQTHVPPEPGYVSP